MSEAPGAKNPHEQFVENFDLDALLAYENPNAERYLELTRGEEKLHKHLDTRRGCERGIFETQFSRTWSYVFEHDSEVASIIQQAIEGSVLVDLGAGGGSKLTGLLHNVVYVPVDLYPLGDHEGGDEIKTRGVYEWNGKDKKGTVRTVDVQSDMLAFISKVKSDSVNVEMDGIDKTFIEGEDYWKSLAEEIYRATKKGGLILTYYSYLSKYLESGGYPLEELHKNPDPKDHVKRLWGFGGDSGLYRKIE